MITNVLKRKEGDLCANLQTYAHKIKFTGDATYPDGGTPGFVATLQAAVGLKITPIEVIAINCGAYKTQVTETPAIVQTDVETWPVADQDGNTILYKLNGADEATLTLSGAHTTRAQLAASLEAISGIHAYDDGAQVTFKTDEVGEGASLEITGGTALAAYGLVAGNNIGSDELLLRVNDIADGADAGVGAASTDLSGTVFEVLVISN